MAGSPPSKSPYLSAAIHDYLVAHTSEPDEVAAALIAETRAKVPQRALMQIAPEQGALMAILTRAIGARRAIEVGTFTGYSALCVARALPEDGTLICCDVSEEWTNVGKPFWDKAGVAGQIDLRIGPAIDTLRALPHDPKFDLAFIDADKTSYGAYFDELVERVRPGGLILVDNVLWFGRVTDPSAQEEDTVALREFSAKVKADPRVDCAMLPVSDGLTIAQVK